MPKQTYHHGDLHEALINTAEKLLNAHGPDKLSLRGLAREAGVSQTAPYRHFADKDALLVKVATRGFRDFTKALQNAVTGNSARSPKEQLTALSRAYIDFSIRRTGVFQLMFLSDLLPKCADPEMLQAAIGSFRVLAKTVADCQGKSDPEPTDATVIASWAMMHGLSMLLTHDVMAPKMSGGMSQDQVVDVLTQMMLFHPPKQG